MTCHSYFDSGRPLLHQDPIHALSAPALASFGAGEIRQGGRFFSRLSVFTGADCVCGHDADGINQRQQKYRGDEYKGREKVSSTLLARSKRLIGYMSARTLTKVRTIDNSLLDLFLFISKTSKEQQNVLLARFSSFVF